MKKITLVFVFLFLYNSLLFSQVKELSLIEMVEQSADIFTGEVIEVKSEYDQLKNIVTYTTFKVLSRSKGKNITTYRLKQYGGSIDGRQVYLAHIRYFKKGEKLFLMLYPESNKGYSNPVGLNQGVWKVENNNLSIFCNYNFLKGLDTKTITDFNLQDGLNKINLYKFQSLINLLSSTKKSKQ